MDKRVPYDFVGSIERTEFDDRKGKPSGNRQIVSVVGAVIFRNKRE